MQLGHRTVHYANIMAMQTLIKLREKRTLDARQSMMAEIAFMQCQRPGKQQAVRRKRRSAEQEWMRHLVLQQLSKEQIKHVSSLLVFSISPFLCGRHLVLQLLSRVQIRRPGS